MSSEYLRVVCLIRPISGSNMCRWQVLSDRVQGRGLDFTFLHYFHRTMVTCLRDSVFPLYINSSYRPWYTPTHPLHWAAVQQAAEVGPLPPDPSHRRGHSRGCRGRQPRHHGWRLPKQSRRATRPGWSTRGRFPQHGWHPGQLRKHSVENSDVKFMLRLPREKLVKKAWEVIVSTYLAML